MSDAASTPAEELALFLSLRGHCLREAGRVPEAIATRPDVVILGESTPLAAESSLGQLLMSFPSLRVIVVGEGSNWLHVFSKQDKLVTRQTDLLDVLCLE